MKNKYSILCFILIGLLWSIATDSFADGDEVVVIKKMTTPSIVIGHSVKTVGSKFKMNEVIEWESDDQAMYVQIESTKEYLVLTKEAFESKSARTLDNYILTCMASTRSVANNNKKEGRNKELYGGQKRIALVIGNSNYQYADPIKNPIYDALAVTSQLVECGFDTYPYFDCIANEMNGAIARFIDDAKTYDVALLYYAGHGLVRGKNCYYVPVNVNLGDPSQLSRCIDGAELLGQLQSNERMTLVVLDACRTMFGNQERKKEDELKVQMEAPHNMAVVFSTMDGAFALDGDHDMSPFAEGFVAFMEKPGISFADCSTDINTYLFKTAGRLQTATQSTSLAMKFYFQPNEANGQRIAEPSGKKKINTPYVRPERQYEMGMNYYEEKDYAKAFEYLKPLAESGYQGAYFPVADMYHRGLGVKKDRNEAEKWYKKAAEAGDAKAKRILYDKF